MAYYHWKIIYEIIKLLNILWFNEAIKKFTDRLIAFIIRNVYYDTEVRNKPKHRMHKPKILSLYFIFVIPHTKMSTKPNFS